MKADRYPVRLAPVLLLLVSAGRAAAQACAPGDTSLQCRLGGVLNWLEGAAVVLTVILLGVIGVAIHLIRKNQQNRRERH